MRKKQKRNVLITLLLLCCLLFSSLGTTAVNAATVPSWVANVAFRVAKYGYNYYSNNYNLVTPCVKAGSDNHNWSVSLGSVKFNNASANTGSSAYYQVPIKSTWSSVPRLKQRVTYSAYKRSFSSGSKNIAIMAIKPNGSLVDLGIINTNSSKTYEITSSSTNAGNYTFNFTYTDSETWDLYLYFTDVYWPTSGAETSSIDSGISPVYNTFNTDNSFNNQTERLYRVPQKQVANCNFDKTKPLTLQELIDEKTDLVTKTEVDGFANFSIGDTINFSDVITSITYNPDRNVTFFQFKSTPEKNRGLEFFGDLTNDYSKGDLLELQFKVTRIGKSNGVILESLDYLEDYNFPDDAAPFIDFYIIHR